MLVQLHSNPSIALNDLRDSSKAAVKIAAQNFLDRETSFIGSSSSVFDLRVLDAQAYVSAGYPTPIDGDTYPYVSMEANITGQTGQQVADNILALKQKYDDVVRTTERSRQSAYNDLDLNGLLETVARAGFNWINSFSLSSEMGATIDRAYVSPAPDPNYETIEVVGDGVDSITITLPEKSLAADLDVIVESYAPPSDPWRGAYYQVYTNPGLSLALTFTDSTDPAHASSDMKWLVTIRNLPRVSQSFVVDSTTA